MIVVYRISSIHVIHLLDSITTIGLQLGTKKGGISTLGDRYIAIILIDFQGREI